MIRLKIKEIAERKGISQGRLARLADLDPNIIRGIYRDSSRVIMTATLDKIALALNVDVRELIESDPPLGEFTSSNPP